MLIRNIWIAYFLAFCKNAWFWLGVWVFYYLLYTNYAGIGLIETALVVTFILTEIPTGAIADLLGKKNSLMISFILGTIGSFMMAYAPDFIVLTISVIVLAIGGTLYSGTLEALIYDSLKQDKDEEHYPKVISNISSISLIAPALCGLIGGFRINSRFISHRTPHRYPSVFLVKLYLSNEARIQSINQKRKHLKTNFITFDNRCDSRHCR